MSAQMAEEARGEPAKASPAERDRILKRWDLSVIKEHIRRIWAEMHGGDPEGPQVSPRDYDPFADERRFYQRLLAHRSSGHGSVNNESNWKTIALLALGLLQVITLGVVGHFYTEFQQTHDDVVQIKCKLDPQCRLVVSSAVKP